ncbi:calcineurin-like phosphoesterase C-terminal domain-containing protein [Olivibacter sitiensis]|uniref:calcineurin-like phosphoesterase C-terminal domain-containing protein n=1 Tax=Olivibacter sitiensis TaxID=376470 RepID=UPI0004841771|nr:calcineurin-like phosphoesterase family protein [Olivibacter sitiensis]
MKKYIVSVIIILGFCGSSYTQDFVKGKVYHDIDNNGKLDKKDKGIEGVSVSNGVDVVQTDKNGFYELPISEDAIIFVIKPANYSLPINDRYQPQFYYIHKPKGSPELKYAGVAPTGRLPKSVDFGLVKEQGESSNFLAMIFGDSQPYNKAEVAYFKKAIVDEAVKTKGEALFGLTLGDLVGDDLSLHDDYKEAIAGVALPWFNVMGNHDMNYDVDVDSLSDEAFERSFGPNNYSFNYGNAHFIVLDDIIYPNPYTGKGYIGGFRKSQLDFVENDLKFVPKDKLVVISYHIPLFGDENVFRQEDRKRLFSILKDFPHVLGLSAHTHFQTQFYCGEDDGWQGNKPYHEYNVGTTNGDWYSGAMDEMGTPTSTMRDGTPKGYAFLRINGNQYSFDYKVAGKDNSYQIEIAAPDYIYQGQSHRYPVYANFFVGKEGDKVEYRINGGEWKDMQYAEETDPLYLDNLYLWDLAKEPIEGKRPSNPVLSSHLWKASLPRWEVGTYVLEVRATDMFGKTFLQSKTIKVIAEK